MKYIKNNKLTTLIIVAFVAFVIVGYVSFSRFFINTSSPKYGDRLEGIEKVQLTDKDKKTIMDELKKNSKVTNAELNISGRTIEITIVVKDDVEIKAAKTIGNNSYKSLSESKLKYYAVQVFIKKNNEKKNDFPIIGYKHKESTGNCSWTKNRKVTSNENK